MSILKFFARSLAWAGLTAAGALHTVWATGSPWPAKNSKELGKAVVGNAKALPGKAATGIVAGAAFAGGAVAGGALGEKRFIVSCRRLMGLILIARAIAGGDVTLSVLGLPRAGKKFRKLDRKYYRPLFAALGCLIIFSARIKNTETVD